MAVRQRCYLILLFKSSFLSPRTNAVGSACGKLIHSSLFSECTTKLCNGHIILAASDSLPLLNFNRKFTWNLKASAPKALKIDFSPSGMRQINPSERCPDRQRYTLQAFQTTGSVTVGKYCRTGPVGTAQVPNQGSFSLEVPAGQKLPNSRFDVSVGEEIKSELVSE